MQRKKIRNNNLLSQLLRGFTLIEILVAVAILSVLAGGVIFTLKPSSQINKSKDAASQSNMQEIKKALDLYYQDKNCYPTTQSIFETSLNTGDQWKEGTTVYMQKIPFDGYGRPYIYLTDSSSACPQWDILFARLSKAQTANICPLRSSNCVPEGFDNSWACTTSGSTNCAQVSGSQVSGNVITYPTTTPTVTPTGTIAPTPTPTGKQFTIAMPASSVPQFFKGTISNLNPSVNSTLTLTVDTDGYTNPYPITSVVAKVTTDHASVDRSMYLSSGTAQNGGWTSTWAQNDSAAITFYINFTATDSAGNTSHFDVSIR